ncbi:uncharacterized protein LOC132714409 [Ruditapes philippinarum]|uniref:uncharacterized protein LOC132714409 n=1 Tax=Ruditapes philippinarum TaxID=129788 RepID=UPI00295AA1EB|nr:uncharacterized protein LOC132714409 [Ruditapes philippinarum]
MAFFMSKFGKHKEDEHENGSYDVHEGCRACNQCFIRGHKHNAVSFCPSCYTFLCQACTTDHKQKIQDHGLITDDFELCEEYVKLKKKINYATIELTQTGNEADNEAYLAELYRDKAIEEIHKEREKINIMLDKEKIRINSELDEMERKIKSRILEKYTKDFEKFKSVKEEAESVKEDIQTLNQTYESLQQMPSNISKIVATCQEQYAALEPKVKQAVHHNEVTQYKFEPEWEQSMKKMSVPKLGHILTLDPVKATEIVTYKGEINVHSPAVDREFCNIKGMCILSTQLLVAADQQNNSLKLLDREQGKLVSTIPMPTGPRDVTTIKGTQIAVTLPNMKVIKILTLSSDGTVSNDSFIPVHGACRGIIHNNGIFIVSFGFPKSEIKIIDMNGTVIKNMDIRRNPESQSSLAGLGMSPDQKMIYVADEDNGSVTCLTTSGKVKAIYKNPNFERPRGVAVASNGLVYVTGKGKVHELSPNLGHGRIVMDRSHGINFIQSLLYCEQENLLYVGMIAQNTIKKFHIE